MEGCREQFLAICIFFGFLKRIMVETPSPKALKGILNAKFHGVVSFGGYVGIDCNSKLLLAESVIHSLLSRFFKELCSSPEDFDQDVSAQGDSLVYQDALGKLVALCKARFDDQTAKELSVEAEALLQEFEKSNLLQVRVGKDPLQKLKDAGDELSSENEEHDLVLEDAKKQSQFPLQVNHLQEKEGVIVGERRSEDGLREFLVQWKEDGSKSWVAEQHVGSGMISIWQESQIEEDFAKTNPTETGLHQDENVGDTIIDKEIEEKYHVKKCDRKCPRYVCFSSNGEPLKTKISELVSHIYDKQRKSLFSVGKCFAHKGKIFFCMLLGFGKKTVAYGIPVTDEEIASALDSFEAFLEEKLAKMRHFCVGEVELIDSGIELSSEQLSILQKVAHNYANGKVGKKAKVTETGASSDSGLSSQKRIRKKRVFFDESNEITTPIMATSRSKGIKKAKKKLSSRAEEVEEAPLEESKRVVELEEQIASLKQLIQGVLGRNGSENTNHDAFRILELPQAAVTHPAAAGPVTVGQSINPAAAVSALELEPVVKRAKEERIQLPPSQGQSSGPVFNFNFVTYSKF